MPITTPLELSADDMLNLLRQQTIEATNLQPHRHKVAGLLLLQYQGIAQPMLVDNIIIPLTDDVLTALGDPDVDSLTTVIAILANAINGMPIEAVGISMMTNDRMLAMVDTTHGERVAMISNHQLCGSELIELDAEHRQPPPQHSFWPVAPQPLPTKLDPLVENTQAAFAAMMADTLHQIERQQNQLHQTHGEVELDATLPSSSTTVH